MDFQIKIRGFRIELGDIQYNLEQVPSVRESVVACFENPKGGKYLAAYYVSDTELLAANLHDFLAKRIPEYMIPSHFIRVERIPLLSNGKANVSLLPKPLAALSAAPARKIISPKNKTEVLVMRVWSEILGINELSVTDNFFKMGGDSISAINMVCRMPNPVNVSKVYEHPVLVDFARHYNEKDGGRILTLLAGEENAERSYILCPYGGGGAYTYLNLAKALSAREPACCVYAVNLPGHDYGAEGDSFLPINDVAALILKETAERVSGKIVVYSHCVGAALGVELARLLELAEADVEAFFVGGILPPANAGIYGWFFDPWMFVGDKRLMKFLDSLGLSEGNAAQASQISQTDRKETQMLMKAFRYDVRSYYRYFAKRASDKQKKLSVPVFSILGESDQMTKRSGGTRSWRLICDAPMQTIKIKGANHYFIKTHATELAEIMTRALQIK
jgi:surfactin synthase thioesterase subunit